MPGAGQFLRLGPFVGGLNTASDPTAIADAELVTAMNFELDLDGSLISRPAFRELKGAVSWTERIRLLCEGVFSGSRYLIGSNANGIWHYINGTWTLISNTFEAGAAVQYTGKIYFIPKPGSANPGGKWDPVGGFTPVAAIPQGQACVIHKERLFVAPGVDAATNESRLRFSDPGNFDTWPGTNFIDITPGDGSSLIDVTTYNDNLLLFKHNSTHSLSFDVSPAEAVNVEISPTIGVMKQYCMVNYENQVFVYHNGWVYEITDYNFKRLNTKIPFIQDGNSPSPFAAENQFISLLEDRLVCRAYRKIYIYNLRTETWTEWESDSDAVHYFGPIVTIREPDDHKYYAGSCLTAQKNLIELYNDRTPTTRETYIEPIYKDTFTRVTASGWGTSDTGEAWTVSAGSASEMVVSGTRGTMSHSTGLGAEKGFTFDNLPKTDFDVYLTVATNQLAATNTIASMIQVRHVDASNYYRVLLLFNTTQTISLYLEKVVAGAYTAITNTVVPSLTHVINTDYRVRVQLTGTTFRAKAWLASNAEPEAWTLSTVDASIAGAGVIGVRSQVSTTYSGPLPVLFSYDDFSEGSQDVEQMITCICQTKNFDMAIPQQFKRLWWWGADVTTLNNIIGLATPIVMSLNVTWGGLSTKTWGELQTWGQPLTETTSVETEVTTGAGTARRFIKFLMGLRYRQINFTVTLKTIGNTADGPARIFGIIIVTGSRQVVSKQVS